MAAGSRAWSRVFRLRTVVLAVLCGGLLLSVVIPSVRLNGWTESFDITCGRFRRDRYLFGIKVWEEVRETELTLMYREFVGEPPEPVWHMVDRRPFLWRWVYEYSRYGRAAWAAKALALAMGETPFANDAKRAVIVRFFELLRGEDGSHNASDYAYEVCWLAGTRGGGTSGPVRADELPRLP